MNWKGGASILLVVYEGFLDPPVLIMGQSICHIAVTLLMLLSVATENPVKPKDSECKLITALPTREMSYLVGSLAL